MNKLRTWLFGAQTASPRAHHLEKFISGLGALIAIFSVASINALVLSGPGMPLIIASMGASAVLLFATPHSPFTQPWNVLGGQMISALIGVSCALTIADTALAAALAVGLALLVMYYLRCLHPPGGATALSAVIGGAAVNGLGYHYVLTPVMLDTLIILLVAVLFNYCFPWRRYPLKLARRDDQDEPSAITGAAPPPYIGEDDIRYALDHMGSFVDANPQELAQIYKLATHHAETSHLQPAQIMLGRYYSNGRPGNDWSVRKVIDESGDTRTPAKDRVIYRIIVGTPARSTGVCTRAEFARWARYEVVQVNGSWSKAS